VPKGTLDLRKVVPPQLGLAALTRLGRR
jgi:hypothetical protein